MHNFKVMHFGRSDECNSYYMKCMKLEEVSEIKDLGITITSDLKVSQQCMQACAKANKMLSLLNRTIKCKDTSSLVCFINL